MLLNETILKEQIYFLSVEKNAIVILNKLR